MRGVLIARQHEDSVKYKTWDAAEMACSRRQESGRAAVLLGPDGLLHQEILSSKFVMAIACEFDRKGRFIGVVHGWDELSTTRARRPDCVLCLANIDVEVTP